MKYIQQVSSFMALMGQETPKKPTVPSKAIISLRHSLILEENDELADAAEQNDIVEIADALCDLRYVVEGAFRAYGFSPELADELFDEVQASNMSKACKDLDEAVATREYLSKKNENELSAYVIRQVGLYWTVCRKSDMKVLKSINFKQPNLKPILERHGITI